MTKRCFARHDVQTTMLYAFNSNFDVPAVCSVEIRPDLFKFVLDKYSRNVIHIQFSEHVHLKYIKHLSK